MKTKEIIAIGLVTLALLAGCNKEKESTSTSTTTKSVTTPLQHHLQLKSRNPPQPPQRIQKVNK